AGPRRDGALVVGRRLLGAGAGGGGAVGGHPRALLLEALVAAEQLHVEVAGAGVERPAGVVGHGLDVGGGEQRAGVEVLGEESRVGVDGRAAAVVLDADADGVVARAGAPVDLAALVGDDRAVAVAVKRLAVE